MMDGDKRHRLILIEAPMGEGKTEAGMYCAVQMLRKWNKDGFYVALPTAATSNQMVNEGMVSCPGYLQAGATAPWNGLDGG